jgi:hypothetical protein
LGFASSKAKVRERKEGSITQCMGKKEVVTSILLQYTNRVDFQFSRVVKTWTRFRHKKLPQTTESQEETTGLGFTSESVKKHTQNQA